MMTLETGITCLRGLSKRKSRGGVGGVVSD